MHHIVSLTLAIVGVIHLLPLSGALGVDRLAALYGVDIVDPNLALLMRHRAVLFGLLGLFLVLAAWQPRLQPLAFGVGFVSVLSFIALAWAGGAINASMTRVLAADWVALACLVLGLACYLIADRAR